MLLQTILQLNILILATPALAGWTAMPLAHPGAVHGMCVVRQGRTAEIVVPKSQRAVVQARQISRPHLVVTEHHLSAATERPTDQNAVFVSYPVAALASFNPFPHAIRAP